MSQRKILETIINSSSPSRTTARFLIVVQSRHELVFTPLLIRTFSDWLVMNLIKRRAYLRANSVEGRLLIVYFTWITQLFRHFKNFVILERGS